MSMLEVWLLFVLLPGILNLVMLVGALSLAFLIFGTAFYVAGRDFAKIDDKYGEPGKLQQYVDTWRPLLIRGNKIAGVTLIVSAIVTAGIPTKKEVAAMIVIPYVSDNPEFKKLPANIAKHLNELLDEYLPSKEEKT